VADQSSNTRNHGAGQAKPSYEADAQALREKSARLKALRLAKEAAEAESESAMKPVAPRVKKSPPQPKGKPQPLAEWLKTQEGAGRRS
jgi:hypothetical protein